MLSIICLVMRLPFLLRVEIPDFLSAEECQKFLDAAGKIGLATSGLFGRDIEDVKDELQNKTAKSQITRISADTWLFKANIDERLWTSLFRRYALLFQLAFYLNQYQTLSARQDCRADKDLIQI